MFYPLGLFLNMPGKHFDPFFKRDIWLHRLINGMKQSSNLMEVKTIPYSQTEQPIQPNVMLVGFTVSGRRKNLDMTKECLISFKLRSAHMPVAKLEESKIAVLYSAYISRV